MSNSNLPDNPRLDGPPEGKEVVRTFTVKVSGTRHDPDDPDEGGLMGDIEDALRARNIEADVEMTECEDA
jgi:hypothetical protein